jgi:hypothetical protein
MQNKANRSIADWYGPTAGRPILPNKPNLAWCLRLRRAKCAKQTQSARGQAGSGAGAGRPPSRMRQTNPISLRGTGILPVDRNHGQDAHATIPAGQQAVAGAGCTNKPNLSVSG